MSVVYRKIESTFHSRSYIHIIDQAPQNSVTTTAIIADVLSRVKKECPEIDAAFFRSDNGGSYHSAGTIGSIYHISQITGIHIRRWDFSESQSGKGPCDRTAAVVKRTVRLYAAENNKCTNAHEFALCASSHGGNKGVSIVNGLIQESEGKTSGTKGFKIAGIQQMFSFEFSQEGMTAWKAYGVGLGLKVAKSTFSNKHNTATFSKIEAYHEGASETTAIEDSRFWKKITMQQQTVQEETETYLTEQGQTVSVESVRQSADAFSCTEDSCGETFIEYADFQSHLDIGNHAKEAERLTLTDFALKTYKAKLEQFAILPEIPVLQEALSNWQSETLTKQKMSQGWALSPKKKKSRWNEKQIQFLQGKFVQGQTSGRKSNPHKVANEMMYAMENNQPKFDVAEYLTYKQIMGYFSREAARLSKGEATQDDDDIEEHSYMTCDIEDDLNKEVQQSNTFE